MSGTSKDLRVPWEEHFMRQAQLIAEDRSSCDRRHVGAILVRDNRTIATGFNGAPVGVPHCTEAGHDLDGEGHCTRAIHAEMNTLLQCARYGIIAEGADVYSTVMPCWRCYAALLQVRVRRIYYVGDYWPGDAQVERRLVSLQRAAGAPELVRVTARPCLSSEKEMQHDRT